MNSQPALWGLTASDWVQVGVAVVALGAGVIALVVGALDRRTQLAIARRTLAQMRLVAELDYAVRLSANLHKGGSSDAEERSRLAAEAVTLVAALGPDRVPRHWKRATEGKTIEQIAGELDVDTTTPQVEKDALEASFAVRAIARELRDIED